MKMRTVYFAGPLFSEAERNWIRDAIARIQILAAESNAPVKIVWPYELFKPGELAALGDRAQSQVFRRCREHLQAANILIAWLDGALVDDGTAWEIGYYFAVRPEGAPIIGIRTDQRRAGEFANSQVNAMIECSCNQIANSVDDLMRILKEIFARGDKE